MMHVRIFSARLQNWVSEYLASNRQQRIGRLVVAIIVLLMLNMTGCSRFDGNFPERALRPRETSTPAAVPKSASIPLVQSNPADAMPTASYSQALDLTDLTTEEQLTAVVAPTSDLNDLVLRLRPEVDAIPTVPSMPVAHQLGDEIEFWVHNTQRNETSRITAELIHVTDVVYAWVEKDAQFERNRIIPSLDNFSEHIYPASVEFFGQESSPGIDNDPRMHILHSTKTGSGIAGYFNSSDQYSSVANPFSNEKEMFYISLNWLNSLPDYSRYESVLAHELQHMIHWANDRNETSWVNEGLSEFSKEIAGFGPVTGFIGSYSNQPDTQLNTWNETGVSNAAHYGSAYLFITYFAQRYGSDLTKALVANPANGAAGFNRVLEGAGLADTFKTLFADWLVANYIDDPFALGGDGIYGYKHFDHSPPTLAATHDIFPTGIHEGTVANYGVDYILLQGDDNVSFSFHGSDQTQLADRGTVNASFGWWSNRGDEMDSHLTRKFDFSALASDTKIEFTADMWWDIETGYDYGYALVSTDRKNWHILQTEHTTLDNPSGGSFGAAYNGKSGGGEKPGWISERYDLSEYAGQEVWMRFELVTDGAVNMPGWFIDNVEIAAIEYNSDFERGTGGWQSEGWLLTDNSLPQQWLVQVLTLQDNVLEQVHRVDVDAEGKARFDIDGLGKGRTAVITISGTTLVTTEIASYSYSVDRK